MIAFSIKEAFQSLARAKFASLITVITLTIASLFFTMSLFFFLKSKRIENELKNKIEIRLFLKDGINKDSIAQLKSQLNKDKRISIVTFKSKAEAAIDLKKSLGSDFTKILGKNPLPSSFVLHVNPNLTNNEINKLIKEFKLNPIVDDVVYDKDEILFLLKTIFYIKLGVYLFALVTIIISLYLILSVNRLVQETRRKIYGTMKLFGAKLIAIRLPIILSSILLSLLAVILGIIFLFFSVYLLNKFLPYINFESYFLRVIAVYLFSAFIFGILGGVISARKVNLKFER